MSVKRFLTAQRRSAYPALVGVVSARDVNGSGNPFRPGQVDGPHCEVEIHFPMPAFDVVGLEVGLWRVQGEMRR